MSTVTFDYNRIEGTITTSGNEGEWNLPAGLACEVLQIIIEPAIPNNMYRAELCDVIENQRMWKEDGDGKINYIEPFPIWGSYKVRITNATSDDTFKVVMIYR